MLSFAMAGIAEEAALMGVLIGTLILLGAGLLLVAGAVFRSTPVAAFAAAVCLVLALICSGAALGPPLESEDPDAHHWDAQDRAVAWCAIGLACASLGSLGFVVSLKRREAAVSAPAERVSFTETAGRWGLLGLSGGFTAAGVGITLLKGLPCCLLLLLAGLAVAGTAATAERE